MHLPCNKNHPRRNTNPMSKRQNQKLLYMKKEKLNNELYEVHLKAAREWGKAWKPIENFKHDTTNKELERKYKTMEEKLDKLTNIQMEKPYNTKKFYHHVINKTDIIFSNDELLLLSKGPKYNLNCKNKNWIRTRVLQAETSTNQLPAFVQQHTRYQVKKKGIKIRKIKN